MNNIIEPDDSFDFLRLHLGHPTELPGKSYFTKIFYINKPLYIQTPKCLTKQGFLLNGKKNYCDLMFDSNDTLFIQWVEMLETRCQELLYEKREEWFQNTLEKSDIESSFTSPIKIFKSGKYYLIRVNLKPTIKIYNEVDDIVLVDNFPINANIVSILEIKGIKFTSRNFQFEFELKQSMIVSPDPFLDTCFIKKSNDVRDQPAVETFKSKIEPVIVNDDGLENVIKNDDCLENDDGLENGIGHENDIETVSNAHVNTINASQSAENIILTVSDCDIGLEEVNLSINACDEPIVLKKPTNYYYSLYETAKQKAKDVRNQAIAAYLEAKHIKQLHKLEDFDEDFGESFNEIEDV
jgi:hypothetical protein